MTISFSGLASNLPVDQMINQLMAIEEQPLNNLYSEKMQLQDAKGAWRDVNSRISTLDGVMGDLKEVETFNSMKTSSTDETIVSATTDTTASASTYDITVNNLAEEERVASAQQSDSTSDLGYSGDFDITVNGSTATVSVVTTDSLTEIKDKINSKNITATATIVDNHLLIEGDNTGAANRIQFTDSDGLNNGTGILEGKLGFDLDTNGYATGTSLLQQAQDANFDINGLNITRSTNTIDDVITGVTFELKAEKAATITVEKDLQKTVDSVQKFVDQYNSVQSFINDKLSYNSDTKEAGILQGDTTLSRLQMNLRQAATDSVNATSKYDQLATVGIEVDKDGKMSLDSSKLKGALQDKPQAVVDLFNASKADGDSFDGVITKTDNYVNQLLEYGTGVIPDKLDYYDNQIEYIEDEMTDMRADLEMQRQRYQEQFTAMETAIQRMQNQSSWMSSQLSGMNTSLLSSM